jgi:hypothetical protein
MLTRRRLLTEARAERHTVDQSFVAAKLIFDRFAGRISIHALREIAPMEEITTDYLYELDSDQTSCRCRTAARGEMTSLSIAEESAERARRPTAILAIERAELSVRQVKSVIERDAMF